MIGRRAKGLVNGFILSAFLSLSGRAAAGDIEVAYQQKAHEGGPAKSCLFSADTSGIRIDHFGAWGSCCLQFVPKVEEKETLLILTETDQGPPCLCPEILWDLEVTIRGLLPGTYGVFLRDRNDELLATAGVVIPATETAFFVRGQVNADTSIDISDAVSLLAFLFLGTREPPCLDSADANDDGSRDLSDAVYLLEFLFRGGPDPKPPYPEPGEDPTPDSVVCPTANSVTAADFVRDGDFNGDGSVDLSDGVAFMSFLFLQGPGPTCADAVDGNDDGVLDMNDLCFVCPPCGPFLWIPGPTPEPLTCGPDPTPDRLGCEHSRCEL